jgi:predicted solute-binding protein
MNDLEKAELEEIIDKIQEELSDQPTTFQHYLSLLRHDYPDETFALQLARIIFDQLYMIK